MNQTNKTFDNLLKQKMCILHLYQSQNEKYHKTEKMSWAMKKKLNKVEGLDQLVQMELS
jgi:hypothetical protein